MKNNKLKTIHSRFELAKSDKDLVILNSELESVRGGRSADNHVCGLTVNYQCGGKKGSSKIE